jgi:putative ABC transport system ATP-binding protein
MSMLPFVRRRPAPVLATTVVPDILQPRSAPQTAGPIIECMDIVRTYHLHGNAVRALKGVSLEVQPGTMVALRGRSGSGKTTLLNIMGGLDRPTTGSVRIEGHEIGHYSDAAMTDLRRRKMAFVFQSYALLPVLSALENVELAMRIARIPRKGREQRARELLDLVGLGSRVKHRPYELSGGQQQRVAIARALSNDPRIILADEPTGELDSVTGLQVLKLFRKIVVDHGVTVVIATHDPTINEIAHVTYQIQDGRLERM